MIQPGADSHLLMVRRHTADRRGRCAELLLGLSAVVVMSTACSEPPTAPRISEVRVDPAWVTAEAASAVDPASGLFVFSDPGARYVTLASAETIAVAVARFLGDPALIGNGPASLQEDRGGSIDFGRLLPCQRAIYSWTPVGDFPPPVPGWVRRAYSSHWAVPLCGEDGTAQLSVGVPDAPQDIRVVDGHLVFRQTGGGGTDFDDVGIPFRFPSGLPLTPEAAVQAVFERTGVRTRLVPTAFNQFETGVGQFPLCASWRIALEHAVMAREDSSGATRSVEELYVRHGPACFSDAVVFFVPAPVQPTNFRVRFPRDTTGRGNPADRDSAEAPLVGPTNFERVTVMP